MKMLAVKNFFSSSIIYYNLPQTSNCRLGSSLFQDFEILT